MKVFKFYYNYYHFEAFFMNNSLGDDFGCSFIQQGKVKVPFYIKNHYSYIKKMLEKESFKIDKHSLLITLYVRKEEFEKK